MSEKNFSIRSLFFVITVVGLSAVALKTSNGIWMTIFANSLVGFLCFASAAAIVHRQPQRRAFWTGFAVFGWVFLVMHGYVGHYLLGATSPFPMLIETYGEQIGDQQRRYFCGQIATSISVLLLSVIGGVALSRLQRIDSDERP